jgi:predicted ABC-type transport system involved in lysophospholipase L1 biosynthesis ATPase subunit
VSAPAGAKVIVDGASKSFGRVVALHEASLRVDPGEAVAITGRSGSGKSTLLALIGGLEQPDAGEVLIDGRALWRAPHPAHVRREVVGFVFQSHLLLAALSARTNVEIPLIGTGMHRRERQRRASALLEQVGLAHRSQHLPSELSGGERQRVAVARALVNEPRLLLADEPTGALDSATSERVLDLLFRLRDRLGMTMLVVSYDRSVGARADRTVTLVDGHIESSSPLSSSSPPRAGPSSRQPSAQQADPQQPSLSSES